MKKTHIPPKWGYKIVPNAGLVIRTPGWIIGKMVIPLGWGPLNNQPHIHLTSRGYLLGPNSLQQPEASSISRVFPPFSLWFSHRPQQLNQSPSCTKYLFTWPQRVHRRFTMASCFFENPKGSLAKKHTLSEGTCGFRWRSKKLRIATCFTYDPTWHMKHISPCFTSSPRRKVVTMVETRLHQTRCQSLKESPCTYCWRKKSQTTTWDV